MHQPPKSCNCKCVPPSWPEALSITTTTTPQNRILELLWWDTAFSEARMLIQNQTTAQVHLCWPMELTDWQARLIINHRDISVFYLITTKHFLPGGDKRQHFVFNFKVGKVFIFKIGQIDFSSESSKLLLPILSPLSSLFSHPARPACRLTFLTVFLFYSRVIISGLAS